MAILRTVLFSLTIVFLIVGIHQTMFYGYLQSYFFFTFAVFSFLLYGYVKKTEEEKKTKKTNK